MPDGAIRIYVYHQHLAWSRCSGHLDVAADKVTFTPTSGDPSHGFTAPRDQVTTRTGIMIHPMVELTWPGGEGKFLVVPREMVAQGTPGAFLLLRAKSPRIIVDAVEGRAVAPTGHAPTEVAGPGTWQPKAGLFRLEDEIDFNVLDGAFFDRSTGQFLLYGHQDSRYAGRRIPYLQHLAALLETPRPEMTLEWTRDSERRVRAFLEKAETREGAQRDAKALAQFLDRTTGKVNELGKIMLPAWGIRATRNGAAQRGYLGLEVAQHGDWNVRVTRVTRNSPAAEAGIQPGMVITAMLGRYALTPGEFYRVIGYRGAGSQVSLSLEDGSLRWIKLGAEPGDAWNELDWQEILYQLVTTTSDSSTPMAPQVLDTFYALQRVHGTPAMMGAYSNYLDTLGLLQEMIRLRDQYGANDYMASRLMPLMGRRLEEVFALPAGSIGGKYSEVYARTANHSAAGAAMDKAMDEMVHILADRALTRLRSRAEGMQLSAEVVDRQWGVRPMVEPRWLGMKGDTQLARVMLAADYLGKRLVNLPELKQRIAGYQTQYEYLQRHPGEARDRAAYRMWISVDRFTAAQSRKGSTLEIRDIKMRFNLREIAADGRNRAAPRSGYEELLTSRYDAFAQEFPILHELREASKVAGVAEWIRSQDASFRLPAEGASPWSAPRTLPGMVFVYLGGTATEGEMTTFATGGVALTPFEWSGKANLDEMLPVDASVVDLRDMKTPEGSRPVVAPLLRDPEPIRRHLKAEIFVPLPIEGWVGKATRGRDTVAFVSALRPAAGSADALEAQAKLDRLLLLAQRLEKVEEIVNGINQRSPDFQQRTDRMISQLAEDEKAYRTSTQKLLESLLGDVIWDVSATKDARWGWGRAVGRVDDRLKGGTWARSVEGLQAWQELDEEVESCTKRLRAARSDDRTLQWKELQEMATEVGEDLIELAPPGKALLRLREVAEVAGGFAKLQVISDYRVERLMEEGDTRLRALTSLSKYQAELNEQIAALKRDPQIQALLGSAR